MFSMASSGTLSSDPETVLETALARLDGPPSLIVGGVASDASRERMLAGIDPDIAFHGSTSCSGVMTEAGTFTEGSSGSGFLAISDPDGDYGSAIAPIRGDAQAAAATALIELRRAGRGGRGSGLAHRHPGRRTGDRGFAGCHRPWCPIAGTAADNEVAGNWLFNQDGAPKLLRLRSCFLVPLGYAFTPATNPRRPKACDPGRGTQHPRDRRQPGAAAQRLDGGWSATMRVATSCSIPPTTRWAVADAIAGFDYFLLSHPNVTDEGALSLFSDIEEGDEVTMMVGSSDNLVQRAAWVADNALDMAHLGRDQIAGALVIYCAGCMLTDVGPMTRYPPGLPGRLATSRFWVTSPSASKVVSSAAPITMAI